jgi:hypothetical protein
MQGYLPHLSGDIEQERLTRPLSLRARLAQGRAGTLQDFYENKDGRINGVICP